MSDVDYFALAADEARKAAQLPSMDLTHYVEYDAPHSGSLRLAECGWVNQDTHSNTPTCERCIERRQALDAAFEPMR